MTRRWLVGLLLMLFAVPAQAKSVAVIPATVGKGAPANGRVVTRAVEEALSQAGFTLLPANRVDSALRARNVDRSKIIPIGTLAQIRRATGADYVIYPRVLSVGVGVNAKQYSATVILNVTGSNAKSFVHTRQVGQVFEADTTDRARAVIDAGAASEAAAKLLEGFFAKVKP